MNTARIFGSFGHSRKARRQRFAAHARSTSDHQTPSGQRDIAEQHRLGSISCLVASVYLEKRRLVLALLKDGESPWQFEREGTFRSQSQPRGFYCTSETGPPLPARHLERGQWFWSAARHYEAEKHRLRFQQKACDEPIRGGAKEGRGRNCAACGDGYSLYRCALVSLIPMQRYRA